MPRHSDHSPPATLLFRGVAVCILFLAITICGFQVLGAIGEIQHADPQHEDSLSIPAKFTPATLTLVGGIALAALLEGMARLILAQRPSSDGSSAMTIRLLTAISELQAALPTMIAQSQPPPQPAPAEPAAEPEPVPAALPPSIEVHLEHMVKLLEEMKEVSMLDEGQRQNRRKQVLLRRKASRLEEAARMINRQNWEEADALLHLLESLHPGDADVQACRHQFNDARIAIQADEWERLRRNAEELLASAKYDEALAAATTFLDRFPAHPDCQHLAMRIRHDAQAFHDATSNRMYEEIKAAVEARQWRGALDSIQRFLDLFPDHLRAPKIRNQIRVIQKNAEIEERRTLEDRIRDLINAKQYGEAADLSEDLLQRFPDSPQAAYLTDLLPKLRERAGTETQEVGT